MAVKNNEILIGSKESPLLALDNDNIISVSGNLACDLLCEEIPIDTLEIRCRYDLMNEAFHPSDYAGMETADGMLLYARTSATENTLDIPYATPLWYYNGGAYVGKFYIVDAKRTGKMMYTIKAQSAIGVLDALQYYGKLFVRQPLEEVIRNILLTDGMVATETPFLTGLADSLMFSPDLQDITVSGWIPVCTKREALHQVLFAEGLNLIKDETDIFLITKISGESAGEIDVSREYDGGTVNLTDRVKSIEVMEHSYVHSPITEPVVLYDNTEYPLISETMVLFDSAPIVATSLVATGTLEIIASNENCAIVSGIGTLTGIPYTHFTHSQSKVNDRVMNGEVVSVTDATLVNIINSSAMIERLFAYYSGKTDMQIPIVYSGEQCGRKYACTTPFGEQKDAYISSMAISASAIAKAECKMIANYVPPEAHRNFTHVVVLTGSGEFQTPQEVLNAKHPLMRVVLIGGGQGGQGGQSGEDGKIGWVEGVENLAKPGNPGKNGLPGKIAMMQLSDDDVLPSFSFSCGEGGAGSEFFSYGNTPREGDIGGPTLFGALSSDVGAIPEAGFYDPLSGNVYGGPAPDYSTVMISGRGGGPIYGENEPWGQWSVSADSEPGVMVISNEWVPVLGGKPGDILELPGGESSGITEYKDPWWRAIGGGGGGGPVPETFAVYCSGKPAVVKGTVITLGNGGIGGGGHRVPHPLDISPTAYGQGGIGGSGGGGGGSSGQMLIGPPDGYTYVDGTPGRGGYGSYGSDGAPGCILVYY